MTRRQREALKLALICMRRRLDELYPDLPTEKMKYSEIAAAMQVIEEMLRGTQGELGI